MRRRSPWIQSSDDGGERASREVWPDPSGTQKSVTEYGIRLGAPLRAQAPESQLGSNPGYIPQTALRNEKRRILILLRQGLRRTKFAFWSRSISRVLSRVVICLGRGLPRASCGLYPKGQRATSTPSYSALLPMGFTQPPHLCEAGGLLHHRFSFASSEASAKEDSRFLFCGTFRGIAPPRR